MFDELVRLYRKQCLRFGSDETVRKTLRKMGVRIGERSRVYTLKFSSEPWLVRIGDDVVISNDVTLVTHSANSTLQHKHESLTGFGKIDIRDNCYIGINATILPNVTIGPNSVVGAGSLVNRDVPPDTVVAGNPAKPICSIEEYEQKCLEGHIDVPLDRHELRKVLEEHFWGDKT